MCIHHEKASHLQPSIDRNQGLWLELPTSQEVPEYVRPDFEDLWSNPPGVECLVEHGVKVTGVGKHITVDNLVVLVSANFEHTADLAFGNDAFSHDGTAIHSLAMQESFMLKNAMHYA